MESWRWASRRRPRQPAALPLIADTSLLLIWLVVVSLFGRLGSGWQQDAGAAVLGVATALPILLYMCWDIRLLREGPRPEIDDDGFFVPPREEVRSYRHRLGGLLLVMGGAGLLALATSGILRWVSDVFSPAREAVLAGAVGLVAGSAIDALYVWLQHLAGRLMRARPILSAAPYLLLGLGVLLLLAVLAGRVYSTSLAVFYAMGQIGMMTPIVTLALSRRQRL